MKNLKAGRVVAAALIMASLVTGCKKKASQKEAEKEAFFAVNTFKTSEEQLDDYLEFGGDVVASSVVNILPDTSGKISRVFVSVGDTVKKDQVLAYIDPSRPGMTYSESPVKAPVSGTVTSFPLSIGATAGTTASIGQISSTGKLEIQTNVAERFISRIKNNQSSIITFDAYPGVKFMARVFEVSPVLDTSTRTLKVKMRLERPDSRVKVGMYARVRLITSEKTHALVIPYDSLVVRKEKQYVFVVDRTVKFDKTVGETQTGILAVVHLHEIKPGIHVDDKLEVLNGLTAGDEIVIRGQTLLNDGSKVNILTMTGSESKKTEPIKGE